MKMNYLTKLSALFIAVLSACTALVCSATAQAAGSAYSVSSPDGQLQVDLLSHNSKLSYSLSWQGQSVLNASTLSLLSDATFDVVDTETEVVDQTWDTVWGQHRQMRDRYQQLRLKLQSADLKYELLCRAYNDGIAFRFVIPEQVGSAGKAIDFVTEYNVMSDSQIWSPSPGAHEAKGPFALNAKSKTMKIEMPTVISTKDERFMGMMETDLYSAAPFESGEITVEAGRPQASSHIELSGQAVVTPWRVILVSDQPGPLVVSQTPLNLAAECELIDTSWIKAGKCLWDWRVHGYQVDGFEYGINTDSYKRFIDFAAKHEIEYFLIDARWFSKATSNHVIPVPALDFEEVMAYAADRGVSVQLYYDRKKGRALKDEQLFPYYNSLGATGIKYGFMKNKASFTREATRLAADNQLLINYHDDPTPMTGIERTLPNAITREWCHAQQDCTRAFTPSSFLKMAFLNALSGPLDQANGIFGLDGVNRRNREFAPKELESFNSTVASEAARVLVTFGGLTFLPDAPEEYEKKADLFEFLSEMPATWDESRVINGRIAEYITTARRSGDEWFVGSVIDEDGGTLDIPLDFLEEGITYKVTYYEDAADTHFVTNRESYQIRHGEVTSQDTVAAKLAAGGGHCMWIRP